MRNKIIVPAVILLLTVASVASAAAPSIRISPKKVGPGDIMVITVKTNASTVEGLFRGKKVYFNPAKRSFEAVVGVDLRTEPGTYPLEVVIDGVRAVRDVVVAKKKYPVQRLTLPEDLVVLSPENEARAERDQKKMSAIWPVESLRVWSGRFIDPLPGRPVGTPFGVSRIINKIPKNPHSGVDITADEGEPVRAPNDGVVILVDDQFYSGKSVVLDHGQGIYTMFFHLSQADVHYGQAVRRGDTIARVGSTGRSTGAHLHWGVRMQGARVDPLQLFKLKLD